MSRRSRSLITYLAAAVLVLSVACGDDGPGNTSDAGTDVETDMGMQECSTDEQCGDLEICNDSFECVATPCTPGENVEEDCGVLAVCKPNDGSEGGTCVECVENADCTESNTFCNAENTCESFQPECTSAGQDCDPNARPGDGYACIETSNQGPTCVRFYADQNACGNNQLCLGVNPEGFPEEENPEKGVCFQGQCNGPLDTTSCEGITQSVLFESFPNGAKCTRVSTGGNSSANTCVPAGTKAEGESCTAGFCQSGQSGCTSCQAGLACQGGTCTPYCESDGECSQGGETCIGEDDDGIVQAGLGFCGETCEPFSRGQCSEESDGCQVINGDVAYCREAGNKGYRAPCDSTTECADGLTCFGFCAPPCASPPGTVEEGERFQYDTTCRGNIRARFLHVADGAGEVDIWYQGEKLVDNVNFGDVTDAAPGVGTSADFYELVPGLQNTEFAVTDTSASDASNPIVSYSDQLLSGLKWTVSIYNGTNGATLHRVPAPRLQPETESGEVVVRAVHEVTGLSNNVDVVAAPVNGGSADLTSAVELAADVGLEAVGEYTVVSAGTYDVYVFPTGAVRDEGNQLVTVEDITLDAGKSIYLHGDAGTSVSATAIRATRPGHTPKLRCWNRGLPADAEAPGGAQGVCIERCELSDYGKDNCAAFPDPESQFGTIQSACTPLQGENDFIGCLATDGNSDMGGDCEGDADCAEGLFCQTGGAESGTCQSQCVAGASAPAALQCPSGTECSATEAGNFGTCRIPCTPNSETDLTDPSCPENLKNCIPERFDDSGNAINAFCQASGSRAEGDACGSGTSEDSLLRQNCQPGLYCTHAEGSPETFQLGFVGHWFGRADDPSQACVPYDPPAPSAQCRQRCDPFPGPDGDSGCADGKSCLPDLAFSSALIGGVCIDNGEDIADDSSGEPCGVDNVGLMCGKASACVLSGDSPICLKFCTNDDDCSGRDVCSASAEDNAVGTCGPPQN